MLHHHDSNGDNRCNSRSVQRKRIGLGSKKRGSDNNVYHLEAPKVNIVNASGAGDAFMAGIAYSIFHNYDLDYKVKFAAIMSMLALESEDTVNNNISLEIVEQRIKTIFN